MGYDKREYIAEMDEDDDMAAGFESAFDTIPPGMEGFNVSHEGGEYEDYQDLIAAVENCSFQYACKFMNVSRYNTIC